MAVGLSRRLSAQLSRPSFSDYPRFFPAGQPWLHVICRQDEESGG